MLPEIRILANLVATHMIANHAPRTQFLQVLEDLVKRTLSPSPETLIFATPYGGGDQLLILCTRVQMTSHAGSARSQRPSPPGPRLRRLSAHRTTSARARLHKPSDLAPSALGRSPFVVGPRAVFADPLAPPGTLLVASMAVVNYHLDLAPLGVRHALSNPRIHVSRACVSVPPPTLQWPIRRPPAHIACAAASLTVFLHLLYLWQVCRRRECRRRGRWRAPQSPAEPSALAAERHSRGRARATRSSGSPAGR